MISIDKVHGDEHLESLTWQQEETVEKRVLEHIEERLLDRDSFREILASIDPIETDAHLHRALCNLDAACKGEKLAINAICNALHNIQRRVRAEAVDAWADEMRYFVELHNDNA